MVRYLLIILLISKCSFAQQGESFGYIISKQFLQEHGILQLKESPNTKLILASNMLYANIISRSDNKLFLTFWDITNIYDPHSEIDSLYSKKYNRKELVFTITKWDSSKFFSFYSLKKSNTRGYITLPFRHFDICALSLPFRMAFYTNKKEVRFESEFLNMNLAFLYNKGKTTIFENHLIKNITRTQSYGPFLGIRAISDETEKYDWLGLNYGLVYGLSRNNLKGVFAFGGESSFRKRDLWILPYISIGIGYDLFSSFEHEIEEDK